MSEEPDTQPEQPGEPETHADAPDAKAEEELRQRLEEELRNLRVEDVLLQSVASLVNLSARRIAKEDERDLDQAKVGIDAVRAVVDFLPEEAAKQVKNALSELQMLYAQHAGGGAPDSDDGGDAPAGDAKAGTKKPGPEGKKADRDSGLWTPRGS